ncbi:MAG TPA: carboxypeptidase regulatory-like domain-containing protein [Candidatus Dormibacteraeota bacterium]|nr:carboxypeptidase regulatory-like domain-containing protein [Candidatus Dormibacteraeota bacterium]
MNSSNNYFAMSAKLIRYAPVCSFFLVLLVFAFAAATAHAQIQNGVFTGTVTDPQGAAVASADVTVTNLGTNASTTAKTNSDGAYRVAELLVGTYKFTVTAQGFKKAVKSGLYLGAGTIERVDFKLELGAQTETVVVEAGAVQVQTEDSRLFETIGAGQVANLPLNGRNVFDLITLAPGAVDVTGVSFENGHSTVVNGLRPNFNGFMVNGSADKGLSGGVVTVPNADIVQEFQELTLNMSAQYGNSAAAIINVVTKSGSNSLHGSVYEFVRNDKFDANDTFRLSSGDSLQNKRPAKLRYNQFGGTVMGPIWKDHLFFTASYQGDRFITQADPINTLVESPEWRAAIIGAPITSGSVAAAIYKNFPAVTNGDPTHPLSMTLSSYIAGNNGGSGSSFATFGDYMCPDNYPNAGFTPLAGRFRTLFGITASDRTYLAGTHPTSPKDPTPIPNCPTYLGAPPALLAGQITNRNMPFLNEGTLLFGSQTKGNLFDGNEWSTRIDWVKGQNDRIFGEFYWQHSSDSYGPSATGSSMHNFKNPTAAHYPNLSTSWVHTFSPSLINEARAGYVLNRTDVGVASPGVPAINFDDTSAGFGSYSGYPQYFHENIYTYGDMMSLQKGKHNLKFGADFRRNLENSEFNIARPSYYFMDQLFFAMDAPYNVVAGTDPGFISNKPAELADNFRHWRNLEIGAYIQDDWKVSRKLTLNIGMRWDLFTRHTEKNNKVTTFIPGPGCQFPANGYCADWIMNANVPAQPLSDPIPLDPKYAGCNTPKQIANNVLAGVCGPGGFAVASSLGAANHKNFGPRVGFAYDPWGNGKTAIRGGFGVSYEGTLYNPLSNSRWNPPYYNFAQSCNALATIEIPCSPSVIVYGPTAACDGSTVTSFCPAGTPAGVAACNFSTTACSPSGAPVTYTGPPANPGIGVGVQGTGNIQGFYGFNPKFANLTGIVLPQGLRDPHVFNYYFGIQQQILPKTVLEVNYVGTQARNLFRAEQVNRLPGIAMAAGTTAVDNFGRTWTGLGRRYLNPNYATLRLWDNVGRSWYNALQVAVRHQATRGLALNINYAWSHSIDTGSGWHSSTTTANGSAGGDGYSTDPTLPDLDKGNSTFDIRHRLSFNYVYEIPWMKEQKGFAGHVFGGWQYQGLWAFQSGAHFTPYCATGSRCDFNKDGTRNDRPDGAMNNFNATSAQWMNGWFNAGTAPAPCRFGANGSGCLFTTPCLACSGNLARNTFVGPGLFVTDQSLFKNIKVTERVNFQFRFEVFNAFNHPNFKLPSSATGANFANRITSTNFGQSAGEIAPRHIQFGLKLLW